MDKELTFEAVDAKIKSFAKEFNQTKTTTDLWQDDINNFWNSIPGWSFDRFNNELDHRVTTWFNNLPQELKNELDVIVEEETKKLIDLATEHNKLEDKDMIDYIAGYDSVIKRDLYNAMNEKW